MRASFALSVALIFAFAGLAGCIGANKEGDPGEDIDANKLPGTDTNTGTVPGTKPAITVLAPLSSAITIDAPEWVQSGTEVPVTLAAPSNAKGALTYTWAIGPLPGTVKVTEAKADTGSKGADYIQPGASKSITYGTSGIYRMHCHPHPDMRHNVTVIEGFAGPKTVEVQIVDGATKSENRYVPENIVVGVGTVVTYKNVGQQPHTATALGAQEPPLKKLPLATAAGNVKVEGEGWQRIVAVFQDADGRFGIAEKPIYTTATLPSFATQTETFEFTGATAAPLTGTPAGAAPESRAVSLEQRGTVTINYTFQDAVAGNGGPQNLAEVELHFTLSGETQDTLTGGPEPTGTLTGKAPAGTYSLTVVPLQGAQVTGTVTIEVVYELVPPPPTAPSAEGGAGHGGHAH